MTKKKNRITTIFNLRIDLKCQFKAYCAARGKSMTEVLEQMILEKLRKN